jgi:hypothetical protein
VKIQTTIGFSICSLGSIEFVGPIILHQKSSFETGVSLPFADTHSYAEQVTTGRKYSFVAELAAMASAPSGVGVAEVYIS